MPLISWSSVHGVIGHYERVIPPKECIAYIVYIVLRDAMNALWLILIAYIVYIVYIVLRDTMNALVDFVVINQRVHSVQ